MRLEPLYTVTFTTPEAWSVEVTADAGIEERGFLLAEVLPVPCRMRQLAVLVVPAGVGLVKVACQPALACPLHQPCEHPRHEPILLKCAVGW
jgi:hypothetical protein